ncbi:ORF25 [Ranid herpesvirus 1]|uniref:ORF25 n=1 Tax=Ranid herpesvirus 1 TaxID=85655 RepID=Q14VT3_9VIRU|nr:ORF25 [Ranid herpesvirus 1]ABG25726.1 ORF25 [Ranid herpesvirus 1]
MEELLQSALSAFDIVSEQAEDPALRLHFTELYGVGRCTKSFRRICTVYYGNTPGKHNTPPDEEKGASPDVPNSGTRRLQCGLCGGAKRTVVLKCCDVKACEECVSRLTTIHPCAASYLKCDFCGGYVGFDDNVVHIKCCKLRACPACASAWYGHNTCSRCGADVSRYVNRLRVLPPLLSVKRCDTAFKPNYDDVDAGARAELYSGMVGRLLVQLPPVPQKMCVDTFYTYETLERLLTRTEGRCGRATCLSGFVEGAQPGYRLPPLLPPEHPAGAPYDHTVFDTCVLCILTDQTSLASTLCVDGLAQIEDIWDCGIYFWTVRFCPRTVNMQCVTQSPNALQIRGKLGLIAVPVHYHYMDMLRLLSVQDGVVNCTRLRRLVH